MAQFKNTGTKGWELDTANANPGDFYKLHRGNRTGHSDEPVSPNDA